MSIQIFIECYIRLTNDRVLAIFYIPLGIDFVKFQIFSVRVLSVVPSADLILRPFTLLRSERPL